MQHWPVRRACQADLPAVAALHAASFTTAWAQDEWQRMLQPPGNTKPDDALFFVIQAAACVETNTHLAGFLFARRIIDEAEIISVAVEPLCRRGGVGQSLLSHLIGQLKSDPPCRLLLEVSVENRPALAFYKKNGFIEVSTRKSYYAAPGRKPIDAKLLARDVDDCSRYARFADT